MHNTLFDTLEVLLGIFSVYALRKSIFSYLSVTKKALFLTLTYAAVYAGTISLLAHTYVGQHAFAPFVDQNLVLGSIWFLIAYAILLVFSEELFFRLYLSKKIHVVLAALIFSAAHWRPGDFPFLMFPFLLLFALMQGSLLRKTNSLWAVGIAHLVALFTLVILYG